jgi:hypothetical protein
MLHNSLLMDFSTAVLELCPQLNNDSAALPMIIASPLPSNEGCGHSLSTLKDMMAGLGWYKPEGL